MQATTFRGFTRTLPVNYEERTGTKHKPDYLRDLSKPKHCMVKCDVCFRCPLMDCKYDPWRRKLFGLTEWEMQFVEGCNA